MSDLVFKGENNQVLTNSLLVAKEFEKGHDKVIRDIRNLNCSEEFRLTNFGESVYKNEQGKVFPMFTMTKDGFSFLVMGYTGKKAATFKEAYIKAFNQMENAIRSLVKPMSQLEVLQMTINQMVEQEKRLSSVEKLALEQKERLDKMEQEQADNAKALLEVELSDNKVPEVTMRNKIRKLVNQYSRATNTKQQDVWHNIYDTLYYAHNISVNSYRRKKGQSNLDIAEEHGFLGKMFDVISNMAKAANLKIA